ncbi:hypothetical protein ACF1G5_25335 [Streptomyces coeruleorubidus]
MARYLPYVLGVALVLFAVRHVIRRRGRQVAELERLAEASERVR